MAVDDPDWPLIAFSTGVMALVLHDAAHTMVSCSMIASAETGDDSRSRNTRVPSYQGAASVAQDHPQAILTGSRITAPTTRGPARTAG
ncbi:MAG TPA: hypothetical protein VFP34_01500 [Microlunatus sp.]|nr:hypothetical protein [Microlunatus sp.]